MGVIRGIGKAVNKVAGGEAKEGVKIISKAVNEEPHQNTGHTGGRELWGGGRR